MLSRKKVKIEDYLRQQKKTVDGYLDDFLPPLDLHPEIIHQTMRYSVFAGGKRIRPILALATGEALEGDFQKLIYLACALEMIHTYSLIHDDLPSLDDDDYRRGQLTAHKKFGEGIAILAGTALLTLAFQLIVEMPSRESEADTKLAVMHRLCRAISTTRGMLGGQVMDLQTQGKPFTREQLEEIHSAKTGALIHASISCAALVSQGGDEVREKMGAFGSSIGLAFQIIDDILDVQSSSKELGKTSGKDDRTRKATYPAMYGLDTSRKIASELIENAIQEISFLGARAATLKELAQFISTRSF